MRGRNSYGNYTNPCLTMHQPWASLLVYGIKRVEGRSWPAPIRGRLWIHAASKVPDEATIKAMEDFYREIYAVNGISDVQFPEHYPVSRLLGCVEVVGCLEREELAAWEMVPEGVRLEAQTDFCWLCEKPQKLLIPFEMRGYQRIYNLEKKIYESAVRGLRPIEGPLPVKFPILDQRDPFSLKPGSVGAHFPKSKGCEVQRSSNLNAAIAGARAAATQFSKKDQNSQTTQNGNPNSVRTRQMTRKSTEEDETTSPDLGKRFDTMDIMSDKEDEVNQTVREGSSSDTQPPRAYSRPDSGAPSKVCRVLSSMCSSLSRKVRDIYGTNASEQEYLLLKLSDFRFGAERTDTIVSSHYLFIQPAFVNKPYPACDQVVMKQKIQGWMFG